MLVGKQKEKIVIAVQVPCFANHRYHQEESDFWGIREVVERKEAYARPKVALMRRTISPRMASLLSTVRVAASLFSAARRRR